MKNPKLLAIPVAILIAVIAIVLLLLPAPEAPVEGYFTYSVENKQVTIKSCDKTAGGEIVVPAEVDGYPVVSIGSYAFEGCSDITGITLPGSITGIQMYAFKDCTSLERINIPKSVTTIEVNAFNTCSKLESISVDNSNPYYSSDSFGVLFNKNQTVLLRAPMALPAHYPIPKTVTGISERAFFGCANLVDISIPDGITTLEWYTFSNCTSLVNVVIPKSLTSVGYEVFKGCYNLQSVSYKGSEAAWKEISFKNGNKPLLDATITYDYCEHIWDGGETTKEPSCAEPGLRTFSCRLCQRTKLEAIPKLSEHTWNEGVVSRPPTCIDPGIRTYTCSVCNGKKTEEIEKLTTHTFNSGVTTKEPTCKEFGITTYTCTICGEAKEEAIEMLTTHTPGPPATDTEDQVCTVCGKVLTPATGTPDEAPVEAPPASFFDSIANFFDSIGKFFEDLFASFLGLFDFL